MDVIAEGDGLPAAAKLARGVSFGRQARFFLPLTVTSVLTLLTHSLFNAGLARLPSPEVLIAAFAVAKSVMHVLESPVMMVRQTVASLVEDPESYTTVRRFSLAIVAIVVVFFGVVVLFGAGRWILESIMGLTGDTLNAAETILHVFIVFPAAATARNFLQGLLIKFQATPVLTLATAIRIVYVVGIVLLVPHIPVIPPPVTAGLMFLTAISLEAFLLWIALRRLVPDVPRGLKNRAKRRSGSARKLGYSGVFRFFGPLIITGLIQTLAMPIINIGLARTPAPEQALAAYAVAWGFGMLFLSPLIMFHQVPINFIEDPKGPNVAAVRHFGLLMGASLSGLFALTAFSPAGPFMLRNFIGPSESITEMAGDVLKLMCVLPLLVVSREFFWGLLMKQRLTGYLSRGKAVNLAALTAAVVVMTAVNPENPAVVGIVSVLVCESAEVTYLFSATRLRKVL